MSRTLLRGQSGGGAAQWQDYKRSFGYIPREKDSDSSVLSPPSKPRKNTVFLLLKVSVFLSMAAAILGSLYWTISISIASSPGKIQSRSYRRLQEQLLTDFSQMGAIRAKELEPCSSEMDNYVPCYTNATGDSDPGSLDSGGGEIERRCAKEYSGEEGCVVGSPKDYRVPLRWPRGRDYIWKDNVKVSGEEFYSGSLTKRMMVEEEHISFHSNSVMVNGVEDYAHQIAEMIGLRSESDFNDAGIRTVLDIECGYGSFGAYLMSKQALTMCIANYELSGSQVQITLERGLPAMIASLSSKQLPFPSLSYDLVHCGQCAIDWSVNDGIHLLEVNRVLRPGGYFAWTSSSNSIRLLRNPENREKLSLIQKLAESFCWDMMSQQDETIIWKKTEKKSCYKSRKSGPEICNWAMDAESPYYKPLNPCIGGTRSHRWNPIDGRKVGFNSTQITLYGVDEEEFLEEEEKWRSGVRNYWSLLTPLIFSDHPKRPGDEDPSPPFNMARNVMDMNARIGGFNDALISSGKSVWVMNVVPTSGVNRLPLIVDRGFLGVRHDWCEAFPSYPRTYDMLHADRLLSSETFQKRRCSFSKLFLEMDRLLRPEGWVIIRDIPPLIETARSLAMRLKWDCRRVEIDVNSDDSLLICLKLFLKKSIVSS